MGDTADKLIKASDVYHTASKRLVEGRGNLIGRTEKSQNRGKAQDEDEPA